MPSEATKSSPALTSQTEKPIHYTYLKEFRVEQCPLFLQHKCTQHRPFQCFHWHFMNQRRRRPVRKRDGTFNYNADIYCTKYDETTGLCPEGDDCPFLHRTAGDTERRYHLRYYKTGMCVHDTDGRGYCVKNGLHCAFAHGAHDLRPPVYDIRELQGADGVMLTPAQQNSLTNNGSQPSVLTSKSGEESTGTTASGTNGLSGSLDKDRNLLTDDPRWQDSTYVLSNYKTEPCKRPPRLCRQGYACPQYHNNKDKRRSPKKHKYRSTPCPNVKHGDEWGEPSNCENGDNCQYCHTRTEQQFHPEIYKSTRCNDMQQTGFCPRGPFCAFAHVDQEMTTQRDVHAPEGTNLAAILSNALPSGSADNISNASAMNKRRNSAGNKLNKNKDSISQDLLQPSLLANSNSVLDATMFSSPANCGPFSRPRSYSATACMGARGQSNHAVNSKLSATTNDALALGSELNKSKAPGSEREDKEARKSSHLFLHGHALNSSHSITPPLNNVVVSPLAKPFYPPIATVESVVENCLGELSMEDLVSPLDQSQNSVRNSITAGLASLLPGSAPVNIPGSKLNDRIVGSLSPSSVSPPLMGVPPPGFLSSVLSRNDGLDSFLGSSVPSIKQFDPYITSQNCNSFFDFNSQSLCSPSKNNSCGGMHGGNSPHLTNNNNNNNETQRLREELAAAKSKLVQWEEGIAQARNACEAWKHEAEDANRKCKMAEHQRDDAKQVVGVLQNELEQLSGGPCLRVLRPIGELAMMPASQLKQVELVLRADLEQLEKMIFQQLSNNCMVCREKLRSIATVPCTHYVMCEECAPKQTACPFCGMQIIQCSGPLGGPNHSMTSM